MERATLIGTVPFGQGRLLMQLMEVSSWGREQAGAGWGETRRGKERHPAHPQSQRYTFLHGSLCLARGSKAYMLQSYCPALAARTPRLDGGV